MDNNFLLNVAIPFLRNYEANFGLFLVHDLDSNIVFITAETAHLIAKLTPNDIIGTNFFKLGFITSKEFESIEKIRSHVIKEKRMVRFLNFSTNTNLFPDLEKGRIHKVYDTIILPIMNFAGDVIATLTMGRQYLPVNLFHHIVGIKLKAQNDVDSIIKSLSPRELEVVYLLANGLSQRDIANFLGITRGTVSKLVTDKIYYKLGIDEPSSEMITQKAIEMGINYFVPKTLSLHKFIILYH